MKTIGSTKLQNVLDVCNFSQASMGKAYLAYPRAQRQVRNTSMKLGWEMLIALMAMKRIELLVIDKNT